MNDTKWLCLTLIGIILLIGYMFVIIDHTMTLEADYEHHKLEVIKELSKNNQVIIIK